MNVIIEEDACVLVLANVTLGTQDQIVLCLTLLAFK